MPTQVSLSLKNVEFSTDSSEYVHELGCYISLIGQGKKRFLDLILFSDSQNKAVFQLDEGQKVQLILKRLSTNESVGSISISNHSLNQIGKGIFCHWMRFFGDEKNDEFTGNLRELINQPKEKRDQLAENDTTSNSLPQVQLQFMIENTESVEQTRNQDRMISNEEMIKETEEEHVENYDSILTQKKKKLILNEELFEEKVKQGLQKVQLQQHQQQKQILQSQESQKLQLQQDNQQIQSKNELNQNDSKNDKCEKSDGEIKKNEQPENEQRTDHIQIENLNEIIRNLDASIKNANKDELCKVIRESVDKLNYLLNNNMKIDSQFCKKDEPEISNSENYERIKIQLECEIKKNLAMELQNKTLIERLQKQEQQSQNLSSSLANSLQELQNLSRLGELISLQRKRDQQSFNIHSQILKHLEDTKVITEDSQCLKNFEESTKQFEKHTQSMLTVIEERDNEIKYLLQQIDSFKNQENNYKYKIENFTQEFQKLQDIQRQTEIQLGKQQQMNVEISFKLVQVIQEKEKAHKDAIEESTKSKEERLVQAECKKLNLKVVRLSQGLYQLNKVYLNVTLQGDKALFKQVGKNDNTPYCSLSTVIQELQQLGNEPSNHKLGIDNNNNILESTLNSSNKWSSRTQLTSSFHSTSSKENKNSLGMSQTLTNRSIIKGKTTINNSPQKLLSSRISYVPSSKTKHNNE